jgi:ADP-ribose pyrophosphatase YjhB (NUDIX family)
MRFEHCAVCGAHLGRDAPCRCHACGAEFWDNPKPCAGALVSHAGKLLLVRRAIEPWAGCWDIPGGFCEPGEHPEATAAREVREETGLVIGELALLGIWMDRYGTHDPPETTMNIYYLATTADPGAARTSAEVAEVRWFGPDELPADLAFTAHSRTVLDRWVATTTAG